MYLYPHPSNSASTVSGRVPVLHDQSAGLWKSVLGFHSPPTQWTLLHLPHEALTGFKN